MSQFRFAYPLVLLILVLPVLIYYQPNLRRFWPSSAATMRYSDVRLMRGLATSWRVRLRFLPDVLRWLGWTLLVVALARPQGGRVEQTISGSGIDIVLALDISNSMAAQDFAPQNRLEAAKSVIGDFISRRDFDRIGLVVFARDAYYQAPLTLDYTVLLELLNEVQLVQDVQDSAGNPLLIDGTAIGLGIASSANMLRSGAAASKVIILLTDGDNNTALDPQEAATAAATLGIRVYTIGVGGAELNESALQNIASVGGGLYFRADNRQGLEQVYAQIGSLERSDLERRVLIRWQDWAGWVLVPALIVLMVERILRRTLFQVIP